MNLYLEAWERLKLRIKTEKTSWGRNELLTAMFEVLDDVLMESEREKHYDDAPKHERFTRSGSTAGESAGSHD